MPTARFLWTICGLRRLVPFAATTTTRQGPPACAARWQVQHACIAASCRAVEAYTLSSLAGGPALVAGVCMPGGQSIRLQPHILLPPPVCRCADSAFSPRGGAADPRLRALCPQLLARERGVPRVPRAAGAAQPHAAGYAAGVRRCGRAGAGAGGSGVEQHAGAAIPLQLPAVARCHCCSCSCYCYCRGWCSFPDARCSANQTHLLSLVPCSHQREQC